MNGNESKPATVSNPPPFPRKTAFAFQAAKCSWLLFVIVFLVLVACGRAKHGMVLDLIAFPLISGGFILGIAALFGIRTHGKEGILGPALAGIAINGLMILIFTSNFFAARKANVRASTIPQKIDAVLEVKKFENERISFQYSGPYKLESFGDKGQILLQNPVSHVLITDYRRKLEVKVTLEKLAESLAADFRRQNYTDIFEGKFEPIESAKVSAGKITLKYVRPQDGQIVADVYVISSETNTLNILHYYSEKRNKEATRLFETTLASLIDNVRRSPSAQ
jgi:hypothetical protein